MPTADLVTSKIMTRINPDGRTYRLPLMNNGTLRIDGSKTSLAAFGDALDSEHDWIEDVVAWMPLPEPYRESEEEQ